MRSSRPHLARSIPLLALVSVGSIAGNGAPHPLIADASFRAAPQGDILWGMLAAGCPVTVLDQREGWVRVRLEGWVPAGAVGLHLRSPAAPSAEPSPPQTVGTGPPAHLPQGVTAEPARGVVVEGTLSVRLGKRKRISASGSPVLLLPGDFQPSRVEGEEDTLSRVSWLETEAERLAREASAAADLPNFTEAMTRRDALLDGRQRVLAERDGLLGRVHARHEAGARHVAVASTATDARGHFAFPSVRPGSYTLYGRLSRDGIEVEWLVPVSVGEAGARVDLDESLALGLPAGGISKE